MYNVGIVVENPFAKVEIFFKKSVTYLRDDVTFVPIIGK